MGNVKLKVQEFGRFLSSMVMPNIGAFIAWGFITALFIPTGWIPNEELAKLVGPMITYLLPLLIGYTGGKVVYDTRGGVVGAITTMGVVVGSSIPMFLGAMIVGPLGGYVIKKFDKMIEGKVKTGFEMLVNNFSAGILGMFLALFALLIIGPTVAYLNTLLGNAVNFLVGHQLLILTSIVVEPAKVLFLNNAINHGVFSPLGLAQSADVGKSIFFLIETNPGPGLGVLLAYMMFEKQDSIRQSATGASIIHFFGGIHEIYFPYILMRPSLILALIAGGMSGVFTYTLLKGGLIAPPSPGSIIALVAMTPKNGFLVTLTGIAVATGVSFFVASFIIKLTSAKSSLDEAAEKNKASKSSSSTPSSIDLKNVQEIVFACDAGMGSSAMGASLFRSKLNKAGLNISVINKAINNLLESDTFIVTHHTLTQRAKKQVPNANHVSLDNFMDGDFYDELLASIKGSLSTGISRTPIDSTRVNSTSSDNNVLKITNIKLGLKSTSKEEAISFAGTLLHRSGYVGDKYIDAMINRERVTSTYIGNGVAIPHGTNEAKEEVLSSGIVILQYKEGVDFGEGNIAKLVIGIAGKDNTHVDLLAQIAEVISDETELNKLLQTSDVVEFMESFKLKV